MHRFAAVITIILLACCVGFVFGFLSFSKTLSDHPSIAPTTFKAEAPREPNLNLQDSIGSTSRLANSPSENPYGCYVQMSNAVVLLSLSQTLSGWQLIENTCAMGV